MSLKIFLVTTLLIPSILSSKATLKLTITPDERYFTQDHQVDIHCELINPNDPADSPQLWHIDLKTGKHTAISRSLLKNPPDDAPDVFKQNRNNRIEYLKKNFLRIKRLAVEDTARYECNCPDCEEPPAKQAKDLQVMKLVEPRWHIEPGWPLQENAQTVFRCTADEFYPYVGHKVIRNHQDVTNTGHPTLPNTNTFPQRFFWESSVKAEAGWHNVSLRCTVTQGNSEQHAVKHLEVLFTPRFLKCDERQHVDSTKDKSTIECSYAGNPTPRLVWLRQSDGKMINADPGITIETKDEHHGRYRSIVTFDREKLVAIPLTTSTRAPNSSPETSTSPKVFGENYYQQLLNSGFIAKLILNNNEEKGIQKIQIVGEANQARTNIPDSSSRSSREIFSTIFLVVFFSMLFFIIHHT